MEEKIIAFVQNVIDIAHMPDKEFIEYYKNRFPNTEGVDLVNHTIAAKLGHISGLLEILINKIEVGTL